MHKLTMILLLMLIVSGVSAKDYVVSSPSGKLAVKVTVNEQVSYAVLLNGKEIVAPSPISMEIS
ncbi:MAG: glycoside hydrolase family 97 N-terminal domain-containing protein, partial [Draconibacterium sp.]